MAEGDLVKKQVHAKIDGVTTVICLHAAGQIRPIDVPFETLNGPYMEPPFHVHCRSLVAPWLPGFVNPARKLANAELLKRPDRIKKMADGRVPNRIPPPGDAVAMAPPPADVGPKPSPKARKRPARKKAAKALAPKRTTPIREGDRPSSPITDVDEAAQYLAARGPMEDVADAVLQRAILRVPDRFEIVHLGGGVSDSYWVTDKVTGEKWVLKKGNFAGEAMKQANQHEDINEWASSWLARRWGLNAPEVRSAGFGWAMMRHVDTSIPGSRLAKRGDFGTNRELLQADLNWYRDVEESVGLAAMHADMLKASIFDFMIDNGDRHMGNWMVLYDEGVPRLGLIDHGLAFDGRARRDYPNIGRQEIFDARFFTYQGQLANGGFERFLREMEVTGPQGERDAAAAAIEWFADIRADIENESIFDEIADELRRSGYPEDVIAEKVDLITEMILSRLASYDRHPPDLERWARGIGIN